MCPQPTLVDLFSGCGGASLGFKKAGFKIVAAVDLDHSACETYSANVGVRPVEGDIREITSEEILKTSGLSKGQVDVVVGCPPCQGFSSLRRTKKRDSADDRDDLLMVFAQRIIEIYPRMVVFENVPGILRGRGKEFLRRFVKTLERHGYFPIGKLLNAADFGIPQQRKRLILILTREEAITNELRPTLPFETHASPNLAQEKGLLPWVTVFDMIADLPSLESGQEDPMFPLHKAPLHRKSTLEIIRNIPKSGGSRTSLPEKLWLPCHKRMKGKGAESVYGRMDWNKASPTITSRCTIPACGRFTHPDQNRAITPREAARLQSFDDDFTFNGTLESVTSQIGNAMPPLLATVIAEAIYHSGNTEPMPCSAAKCSSSNESRFAQLIIEWGRDNKRLFPWRERRTPFRVLLAEMLLQRTPANRVARHFPIIIAKFPEPRSLACAKIASLETVLRPLGLKKRAAWIIAVMQEICKKHNCIIPSKEDELTELPGVGTYTANAVLCFGFRKDAPIVDINVARTLSRVFFGSNAGRKPSENKELWRFAGHIVPKRSGVTYNESMLDHAALVCKKRPRCGVCPVVCICRYFTISRTTNDE